MSGRHAAACRGISLVELAASLVSAALLMAGLTSTMFIALRASNPSYTVAAGVLETSACLADMAAELQFATGVTEAAGTAITAVIPDRNDADTLPETVRYSWSGVAGQPLLRRYNSGTAATALSGVQSLSLQYYPSAAAPKIVLLTIGRTSNSRSTVQTAIPLVNMP